MIEVTTDLGDAILAHARDAYPAECCGLVIDAGAGPEYVRCRNDAPQGCERDRFVLNPYDHVAAEDRGAILAVVHSHPDESANPSDADLVMCERSGYPWIIIGYPTGVIKQIEPRGHRLPLVGRVFHHGVVDCYTLMQDFYWERLGIDLPHFHRDDEWWKAGPGGEPGQNLYLRNIASVGFELVGTDVEPEANDLVLLCINSDQPNHAAMMDGERPGLFLHHLYHRLSCHDVWGGYWKRHAAGIYRYKGATEASHV